MYDIDMITSKLTAFQDFNTMANDPGETYRPSIYPHPDATAEEIAEYKALADAYDAAMEAKGDERRAYRGNAKWWNMNAPMFVYYVDCTAASERGIIERAAEETDLLSAMRRMERCIAEHGEEIYLVRIFQRNDNGFYFCTVVSRIGSGFQGWISSVENDDFTARFYEWTALNGRDGRLNACPAA
jgi:hypothetical protein